MKKHIAIITCILALSVTGCQKWLDINTNPNYIADADISMLLPSAQLMTADKVGYDISLYGHFWAQYVNQNRSSNQYNSQMNYEVTNSSFTSPWSYFYASVLPNLKSIIEKAEADGDKANYILEAKTTLAYVLYMLTSLYDDVAYTEGYVTGSQTPHFDTGSQMQAHLITLLEEIRTAGVTQAAADERLNSSVKADMVFQGNVTAWFQFANTLYLKVLLRDFSANTAKIQALLAENNFLTRDAAFDNFEDKADKSNPFYESDRRQLNTTNNIRCCSDILNVLSANDPRLAGYYYDENPGGVVTGTKYGIQANPDVVSRLALGATDPVYFGTVDEAEFLKAEAYARLNDAANAKACYEAAITAAFTRTGYGAAAAAFIAGDYAFTAGSVESMVEQIINQKWASNVRAMAIESWFDLNRTGYPTRGTTITDFHGVLDTGYPQRFLYSKTSADNNPNSPTPVEVTVKTWWQK